MNPHRSRAFIAFEGDRRIAAGDLREVARAAKGNPRPAQGCGDPDFRRRDQRPDRSRFSRHRRRRAGAVAGQSAPRPQDGRTAPSAAARSRAARNWAWSRARSRCCRGTGNGWRSNPAARRSRSASWSTRRGATGEDNDRIAPAQEAAYRFMSAMAGNKPHYEDAIRALFARRSGPFRGVDRRMARRRARPCRRLAERAFRTRAAERAPVDPANVNR